MLKHCLTHRYFLLLLRILDLFLFPLFIYTIKKFPHVTDLVMLGVFGSHPGKRTQARHQRQAFDLGSDAAAWRTLPGRSSIQTRLLSVKRSTYYSTKTEL
jgi:hypothetical protein